MRNAHSSIAPLGVEDNIMFHVTEIDKIVAPGLPGIDLYDATDIDALALSVPPFVVVPGDELRDDALALGPVLHEITDLAFQAVYYEVVPVEAGLSVDHVPTLVDDLNA